MAGERRAIVVSALALLLVGALAAPARADVHDGLRAPAATEPATAQAAASIAYLRTTYRLSQDEAVRRLELQTVSVDLANELAGRFPADYAGMWLDQIGGTLRVAMVHPEKLGPAVAGLPQAARIQPVRATRSLRQLTATAQRAASTLGTAIGTDVIVDQPTNSVVVYTGDRIKPDDRRLATALGAPEERAQVLARGGGAAVQYKACDPRYCAEAPMRGGIRLDVTRDDGTYGGCTTGFNLVAAATGTPYVLTAGHCVNSDPHRNTDRTYHQLYGPNWPVNVEEARLSENAYPLDYSLLPFQPGAAAAWLPATGRPLVPARNVVDVWCVDPGCVAQRDLPVTGYHLYSAVKAGWVVCATGSAYTPPATERYVDSGAGAGYLPGTRCGEVTGFDGGVRVKICARPGDSGGPLFEEATGMAIGVLSFGDPGSGPCTNPDEHNSYAPISKILDRVNAQLPGRDFRLVTDSGRASPPRPPIRR